MEIETLIPIKEGGREGKWRKTGLHETREIETLGIGKSELGESGGARGGLTGGWEARCEGF
ncbi:hypothetical protein TIFTF001_000688 [Ficus carica]|uniref:Uncharacterized protein n=1 Tax=Ficus carica TaxID=3494 RepID=A0AA88CKF7_FICCA|nr:hypothetical protein TIFTF001_000688 [Ficus carica]